jgi:hypothetical protein
MLARIRSRLTHAIRGTSKSFKTEELLGCTREELKKYLESEFSGEINWETRDTWHVDHRIPCALFDMSVPEDQKKCFHFTNLVPREASINLSKRHRVHVSDVDYAERVLGRKLKSSEIYHPIAVADFEATKEEIAA